MIKRIGLDKYSALYLWGAFIIIFGLVRPDTFLSWTSVKSVIIENVVYGVLAIAFLVPLATGTFDLSIGRSMSMALVIINSMAQAGWNPVVAAVIALLACGAAGAFSGFFVVRLKVDSFIATLGMSQLMYSFIQHTSNQTISGALSNSYMDIGRAPLFGLPRFVYYMVILAIIVWYVLEHTPVGRHMFATGGNRDAARLAGVRTDRLVWLSLIASAMIAGFAGVIYSWKVGTYAENVGPGYLFPAIAAVFFGASQLKGRPNVWGAVIALLSLATGVKGLQLTFSSNTNWLQPLFEGTSLLIAVSIASRPMVVKVRKKLNGPAPDAVDGNAADDGSAGTVTPDPA